MAKSNSPENNIDVIDIGNGLRFAALVAVGVFVTTLLEGLSPEQFGSYAPIATVIIPFLLDMGRRYKTNYESR